MQASEWVRGLQKEYHSLLQEKALLLLDINPDRPALHEALLAKTERLTETAEKKYAIANYVSKIVEELDHGKVTVITSDLELEFEW